MTLYDWKQVTAEPLSGGIIRRMIHSDAMTIARLELPKGSVVPEHSHHNEQIATVERGALEFTIDGGKKMVGSGESLVIPPHVPHGVMAVEDTIVVDVFSPRREDWIAGSDAYLRR